MATEDRFWDPLPPGANLRADYCLGVLEMASYTSDATLVQQWANAFGFVVAGRAVTPGRVIPNFVYAGTSQKLIIAIPGTTDILQMMNNIIYCAQRENADYGAGRIHSFFLWCAESIVGFLGNVESLFPDLQEITFVGHSLGGAVAQLLADWTAQNTSYRVKLCVTFNSPRVGDHAWASRARTYPTHQYFCTHDMVCELPPPLNAAAITWQNGDFYAETYFHRESLLSLQSQQNINDSWMAVTIGKVVYPVKWTLSAITNAESAATFMRALGIVGSRSLAASYVLPLPVWYNEHKMRAVLASMEASGAVQGFPEREAMKTLADFLIATADVPFSANPFPFALAPPAAFDHGQFPTPGTVADLAPVVAGTRTEMIEATFECIVSADAMPLPNLISVDDAFINALTNQAAATPSTSPLLAPNPIVIDADPVPHYLFRGSDRRLLESLDLAMDMIERRDLRTWDLTPTSAISTRDEVIDSFDPELQDQWGQVRDRVQFLLSLAYDD